MKTNLFSTTNKYDFHSSYPVSQGLILSDIHKSEYKKIETLTKEGKFDEAWNWYTQVCVKTEHDLTNEEAFITTWKQLPPEDLHQCDDVKEKRRDASGK